MKIDLNTCVKGQKVKLRNGGIGIYHGKSDGARYNHDIEIDGTERWFTDSGFWVDESRPKPFDVIEIIPLEEPVKIVKLNVFVRGNYSEVVYELQQYGDKFAWVNVTNNLVLDDGKMYDNISSALYYVLKHNFSVVEPVMKRVETIEYVKI